MRILFVVHQFFPEHASGTEQVTLGLARMMQKAGHHVRVLACSIRPEPRATYETSHLKGALDTVHQGVPVTFLPRSLLPDTADFSLEPAVDLIPEVAHWLQDQRFDLLHAMHTMRMTTVIHAARKAGIPYLHTLTDFYLPCARINLVNIDQMLCDGPQEGKRCGRDCNVPPWDGKSLINRYGTAQQILRGASYRVAPSDHVASRYREAFPGLEVQVIPHGLDLLRWLAVKKPDKTPAPDLRLAFVGSIVPQKGLTTLLQALSRIPSARLKLTIAGAFGPDAAHEREVRALLARDSRIELLGQLDHEGIGTLLANSDVLCLPSAVPESYSLTLREAATMGVPALVSNLGAQADFVGHSGAGLVLPANDITAWTQALESIADGSHSIAAWKKALPLPMRIEEEAFLYESLYRQCAGVSAE